jgi:hypothetical protein
MVECRELQEWSKRVGKKKKKNNKRNVKRRRGGFYTNPERAYTSWLALFIGLT